MNIKIVKFVEMVAFFTFIYVGLDMIQEFAPSKELSFIYAFLCIQWLMLVFLRQREEEKAEKEKLIEKSQ